MAKKGKGLVVASKPPKQSPTGKGLVVASKPPKSSRVKRRERHEKERQSRPSAARAAEGSNGPRDGSEQAAEPEAARKSPGQKLLAELLSAGRRLWAPEVAAPASYLESHPLQAGGHYKRKKPVSTKPEPGQQLSPEERVRGELLTSLLMRDLHRRFALLCAKEGLEGKQHASIFERWHFASRMEAEVSAKQASCPGLHPSLPWLACPLADAALQMDLRQAEASEDAARRICEGVHASVEAALKVKLPAAPVAKTQPAPAGDTAKAELVTVAKSKDGASGLVVTTACTMDPGSLEDYACCEVQTVSPLRISVPHYNKLKDLFSSRGTKELHGLAKEERTAAFHIALFCLLERYRGIKGSGFQAALPGATFEVLQRDFGVMVECFASPLNCRFKRFCSAFDDCDLPFCSLGSFFRFCPSEGSFQANPPFVPPLISAMCKHLRMLLVRAQATGKALSYVITVVSSSGLKQHEAWKLLTGSEFLTHHLAVKLQDHRYKEGNQHFGKRKGQVRFAACGNSVLFWQTEAAKERWPVTDEKLARLSRALRG